MSFLFSENEWNTVVNQGFQGLFIPASLSRFFQKLKRYSFCGRINFRTPLPKSASFSGS